MGTVLSSNSSSGTHHGLTRSQLHYTSYSSTSHPGLTDLPEEYYVEPTSDIIRHSFFNCPSTSSDYYVTLPEEERSSNITNTENGSLVRLNPMYNTHGSHTLGLKRIISGLNRKSRNSVKDSSTSLSHENGVGKHRSLAHEPVANRSTEDGPSCLRSGSRSRLKPEGPANIGTTTTVSSSTPEENDTVGRIHRTHESRLTTENTTSTSKGVNLSKLDRGTVGRNVRSGSFNIPYRNGTPYGRTHELVKPMCNACRHMSLSNTSSSNQTHKKRSQIPEGSCTDEYDTQMLHAMRNNTRHVHFNQHRQLSEPSGLVRKRHSQYCDREQHNLSYLTNSPYPQSSPSMTDSRCFTNYALHPDRADSINRSFEQLHKDQLSTVRDKRPPRPAPPTRELASPSPLRSVIIPEPVSSLSATGSCSPTVYSCPYHQDLPPYSFQKLSVTATTPYQPLQSPHPVAIHETQCSVQLSPPDPVSDIVTDNDPGATDRSNAQFTETLSVNPYELERQEVSRSKSLTKSLSCYALKFFSGHHSYLRNRNSGKNDASSSCAPIQTKQKNRSKLRQNTNRRPSVRAPVDVKQQMEGQKTTMASSNNSAKTFYADNSTRDGAVVWCDIHKKHSQATQIAGTKKSETGYFRQSSDPPSIVCTTLSPSPESNREPMYASYSHYTHKPDLADQWIRMEGSLTSMFSRLAPFDSKSSQFQSQQHQQQPILKVGTSELLRCLSFFVTARLQLGNLGSSKDIRIQSRLRTLPPSVIVGWIKSIDRALLLQGWSELAFINPPHVVFLFMLLKECLDYNISSERELHTIVMACLYLSYSYMGNEISYPLKPFLVAETNQLLIHNGEGNRKLLEGEGALMNGHESSIRTKVIDQVRNRFWQYCLRIINNKSTEMLQTNADPVRFTELFAELRSYESLVVPLNVPARAISTPK